MKKWKNEKMKKWKNEKMKKWKNEKLKKGTKIQKIQNFIWPPMDQHVLGTLAPHGDLRSKNSMKQNILSIQF